MGTPEQHCMHESQFNQHRDRDSDRDRYGDRGKARDKDIYRDRIRDRSRDCVAHAMLDPTAYV